jgi:hypothetical protein
MTLYFTLGLVSIGVQVRQGTRSVMRITVTRLYA